MDAQAGNPAEIKADRDVIRQVIDNACQIAFKSVYDQNEIRIYCYTETGAFGSGILFFSFNFNVPEQDSSGKLFTSRFHTSEQKDPLLKACKYLC